MNDNDDINLILPYSITELPTYVILRPDQMNNNIYNNLKLKLVEDRVGKCYENYGYISNIYKITKRSDGIIVSEDPTCSSKFIVNFECKLYKPINNKQIICIIDRINKNLMSCNNGPLRIIITNDKIDNSNFYLDNNRNIRYKKTSEILVSKMYVRINIDSHKFIDGNNSILIMGSLIDMATEKQIDKYFEENEEQLEKKEMEKNNIEE